MLKINTRVIKIPKTVITLLKNQYRDRELIINSQNRKLQNIVQYAAAHVPYYQKIFQDADISPMDIKTIGDLKKLPITSKSNLQFLKTKSITSSEFNLCNLKIERTSGSTGQPFSIFFDNKFIDVRDSLFLRALFTAGYRPGQKVLLLTDHVGEKKHNWFIRWSYASIQDSADRLISLYSRIKPHVLYGCTTALKLLAQEIRSQKSITHKPRVIITAAEMLDNKTRKFLEETFYSELFDIYGLTEMGVVGWECSEHKGYHLAEDTTIVEYLPLENGNELKKLVMTNLSLKGMPFIRYATGDVGIPSQIGKCPCGRSLRLLKKVEGRRVDCIKLKSGQIISPYRVTCAMEKLNGLANYQIIQEDYHQFTVKIKTEKESNIVKDRDITRIMHSAIGPNVKVRVQKEDQILPVTGRKFGLIKCKIK
jgi:phenylacetate-CoA ligase